MRWFLAGYIVCPLLLGLLVAIGEPHVCSAPMNWFNFYDFWSPP